MKPRLAMVLRRTTVARQLPVIAAMSTADGVELSISVLTLSSSEIKLLTSINDDRSSSLSPWKSLEKVFLARLRRVDSLMPAEKKSQWFAFIVKNDRIKKKRHVISESHI